MEQVSTSDANELFHALIRVQKLLLSARSIAPTLRAGLDSVAYPVMFAVHREGLVGISDVASLLHSDVSTVSRQVSGLVAHGLLEKKPDPSDGRATLVSVTDSGQVALEEMQAIRGLWFQRLLADWSHHEAGTFTADLHRLGDALDTNLRERGATTPSALSALPASDRPSTKEN